MQNQNFNEKRAGNSQMSNKIDLTRVKLTAEKNLWRAIQKNSYWDLFEDFIKNHDSILFELKLDTIC